ncbi:hypothetical protein [Paenarthrobacter nitroguajacolicus]|uniref:hypothetical protein n=1 Tax=Paenarthrobacter nitroguajacolicus TaxID=211146 RepID=UPI00248B5CD8|nr:hypothetical protein [Paenarthrobacter nitroguajacolicus]MDI2034867.1 hypothetical protein [Paenarthrobacter nitroguajacolicus]
MSRVFPAVPGIATGPLFLSRSVLVTASVTLWMFSAITQIGSFDGSSLDRSRLAAVAFDLSGCGVAFLASAPMTPRRHLPYYRALWLATSMASGVMTAQVVTLASGYLALAFNVMLGTALVFLVSVRWDLMGFMLLTAANSLLSSIYYAATPRFGSGEGLLIFFITLVPGLLGALIVVGIRSRMAEQIARHSSQALAELTQQADTRASAHSQELSATHHQIQELFARAARSEGLSLTPGLAEEAQRLAARLRTQLLVAQTSNWFNESLVLAGLDARVSVAAQPDLLQRVPQAQRPALLSVTMLLATPVHHPGQQNVEVPQRLHVYVEPDVEEQLLITWRVTLLDPVRCTPALWSEIESLGTPRVQTDPGGASVMVHVKAPKLW